MARLRRASPPPDDGRVPSWLSGFDRHDMRWADESDAGLDFIERFLARRHRWRDAQEAWAAEHGFNPRAVYGTAEATAWRELLDGQKRGS